MKKVILHVTKKLNANVCELLQKTLIANIIINIIFY